MEETHEAPQDHTLTSIRVYPGNTIEGHSFSGILVPNTLGVPQYRPPSQPLHFGMGGKPSVVVEKENFDHIEERLGPLKEGGNYGFTDMSELCLVSDVVIPPKFKVLHFDKYKRTTCLKNHLKMYYRKMGAYAKNEKLLMHFFQESLVVATIIWYTSLEPS